MYYKFNCMAYTQKVNIIPQQSSGTTQLVTTNCNEILFINFGAAVATVKGLPVLPSATLRFGGNVGEKITNALQLDQAVSGDVWIVRKFYVD